MAPMGDSPFGKNILDLANGHDRELSLEELVQKGLVRGLHGEISASIGPREMVRFTDKGAGDHTADIMRRRQDLPGRLAHAVKFINGDDLFMGRNLKDAIGRSIEDRVTC